jgi:hypothetical protein
MIVFKKPTQALITIVNTISPAPTDGTNMAAGKRENRRKLGR